RAERLALLVERLKAHVVRTVELIGPREPDALAVPCHVGADRFAGRMRDAAGVRFDTLMELVERACEEIHLAVSVAQVEPCPRGAVPGWRQIRTLRVPAGPPVAEDPLAG